MGGIIVTTAPRRFGERTRLACWFRRRAETIFPLAIDLQSGPAQGEVRDRETRSPARVTRALPGMHTRLKVSRSQNSGLLETEVTGTRLRWRADDDVVEQFDLQQFRGLGQTSRQ